MEQIDNEEQSISYEPAKPNNYLALAIVCTILCCLPLGIVGIVKANKVNHLYYKGQYEAAYIVAKDAKNYSIIGIAVGAAFQIIMVVLFFFLGLLSAIL